MTFKKADRTLNNAISKINEAERDVYLNDNSEDSVYATCYLTMAKKNIREALEHIRKITRYNEGGDKDEESKQNGRDSGRNR